MPGLPALALALCFVLAVPAAAQTPDTSFRPRIVAPPPDSLLHQGASVQVRVTAMGNTPMSGLVGRSNTSPGCLGIVLDQPDSAGRKVFVYLKAVTFIAVDRRTNQGVHIRIDSPPSESDWQLIPLADLAKADSSCHRK